ncbi:cilia- and flagella-associated protein 184 [Phyllobates terribilis]|uniref:cilia- and flagella-associated protein 184 n=1 Tax=Phyllobates terribilis TaxID=111132 RepID=UPI003CCA74D0
MEDVSGGDRPPAGIRQPIIQPGTGQGAAREQGTSQAGEREPGPGQEGAKEPGTGKDGARDPKTNHEGTTETSTTEEGTKKPNTSLEGTREPNTSLEGTREPNTSPEGANKSNSGLEGPREPNTSREGPNESSNRPESSIYSSTSQDGTRDPSTSQEGPRDPSTSQEGTRDPSTSQEGTRDPSTSQEGTRDPSTSQEVTRDPEASVESESVRDPSTGHITSYEAMEEDGEIGSSQQQGEDPEGTNDDPSQFCNLSEEYASEMDQEPKEDTHPHLEEHKEDQENVEQNQDHELLEMVHEKQIEEELIQQYHAMVQEREKILQHNAQLQHKLYEYFRKKKGEETRPETTSKRASDQEQRYLKYLTSLEEMRRRHKEEASLHQEQMEELRAQCQDIVSKVDKEWAAFQEQKKKISLCSLSKQGAGKHAASSLIQEVDLLQSREERKEKEVIQVRLENIKLKNHINRYESTLRSKEELAESLHLIDFEQLKIENQTYNEKIEERNEELLKLRKKITNTVQVLTHVKEKLQFVQAENQEQKEKLMEVEALVGNKRDILTKTKQARDSLRMDNLKLKEKCGLLGNKVLLRDFEDKVDAAEELRQTLENLKRRHAELTLSSKGLEKKINEVKLVMDD